MSFIDNESYVSFMDVGMGDASLIKDEKDRLVLIDGGPDKSVLIRLSQVVPISVNTIDFVVVSHSHADHITGLIYALSEYKIGCIIVKTSDEPISIAEKNFRTLIRRKKIDVGYANNRSRNTSDCSTSLGANFQLLIPPSEIKSKLNQNNESLLVMYRNSNMVFIFTGDAEYDLLSYYTKQIEMLQPSFVVLKIPHHGSLTSLNKEFISLINPSTGVVSVGNNTYKLPNKAVLDYYESNNIPTLRTDIIGNIEYKLPRP